MEEKLYGDKARVEIERKYLVKGDDWKSSSDSVFVRQGFLSLDKNCTVRVRSVEGTGVITVKGPTKGISRAEFEYKIPVDEAEEMLGSLCSGSVIEKRRYRIPEGDLVWEVDEFFGDNEGLIMAEVELNSEDQAVDIPSWIGEEVSDDARYFNSYLATNPYKDW